MNTKMNFGLYVPTRITFGVGELNNLHSQAICGVADLKIADYGITQNEFEKFTINARATMGGLFLADRIPLSNEDCVTIYAVAYNKMSYVNQA